jgi:tetratricopeptide (TPR) repeat protein
MGCHTARVSAKGPNAALGGPVDPAKVSDAEFGQAAYQLLLTGERTPARDALLVGVVRRQLARAAARFAGDRRDAGLAALTGALYLVRSGELVPAMLDGAAPALRAGAAEVSRVGNEGRALALYGMLRSVLPAGSERDDVDAHLAALSRWSAATSTGSAMQAAGWLQRSSTHRALLDPTPKALDDARDATIAWIKRALELNTSETSGAAGVEREEAVEAYRAVRAGGATLAAIYLRHGDAKGARLALDQGDLLRVVPPGLVERLERASADDAPGAWADLYRLYAESDGSNRPETSLDADLARAAAWGSAVELFRAEPRSLRGAGPMAKELVDRGMAEVAPLVLGPALGESPSAQDLSWAMSLTLRAVLSEDELGDHAAARRTFEAGAPILALASKPRVVGKVRPTAARLHYVMAALETRAGDLSRARPHIELVVKSEPSIEAYNMLAAIDRQRGDWAGALGALDRAQVLARKLGDPISEVEALITTFEVQRDKGSASEAKRALDLALSKALVVREGARGGVEQARAERALARTLELFGATQGAKRATDRAYEAARSDRRQLTATLLDASRRALTLGDLPSARQTARLAIEAGLADEDLVYIGLWLRLLEQRQGVTSDGTAEEVFAAVSDDSGWPAKLAGWARGKLGDEQLLKAARSRPQKTEAKFYVTMLRNKGQSEAELKEIATSEAIELVEVAIARDLLAQRSPLGVKIPEGTVLP